MEIADSDFGPALLAGGSMGTALLGLGDHRGAARELRERLALGGDIPAEGITARADTSEADRRPANRRNGTPSGRSSPRSRWT